MTPAQLRHYRQIQLTSYEDKLKELILDAQISDLKPLIGGALLSELLRDLDNPAHALLLNGGDYVYKDVTYENPGLRCVLAYYTDARLKMFGDALQTPSGLRIKNENVSNPADTALRRAIYTEDKKLAFSIWEEVRLFLLRTGNKLYNEGGACAPRKRFTPLMYNVKNRY